MTIRRALLAACAVLSAGLGYVVWAVCTEVGYAAGGRALKAQYGLVVLSHPEWKSLRRLAMMKAAAQCRWDLDEASWRRIYRLYVEDDRSVRAAVYARLLREQERYFQDDADDRRCGAAWSRFGAHGADLPNLLRASAVAGTATAVRVAPSDVRTAAGSRHE
ncbi:hypothetical protein [Methylobacterium nodulans]|uniref:Uncharacterized protein n=1 Tax=Methylobacterium nodulans (strain LMG 21967 / CNCM I-2342 / ORS 2060) TaxID=460265 RepID=B8ILN8_METNO|nr:hypothetical protein [Methylobacterium nodulans]ACL62013.1 conserved hypothetical protein [Methylobacterium nodulans ORS 2060]